MRAAGDPAERARTAHAQDVFRLGLRGVPWAEAVLQRAERALGLALADLVHALDPQFLVIDGGLAAWGQPWRERVDAATLARVMAPFRGRLEVRLARYGPKSGIAGHEVLALGRTGWRDWRAAPGVPPEGWPAYPTGLARKGAASPAALLGRVPR